MIKKRISKMLLGLMIGATLLSGCAKKDGKDGQVSGNGEDKTSDKEFKIGISQLAEHPALDDARRGFEDGLKELGVNAKIDFKNAQGDIPTATTISQKFANDKVDLIYAIATPAVQSAKQVTSEIPILFSAVTDPVAAGILDSFEKPGGNITGTSDESPIDKQLKIFNDLDPSIKKVGIIFNTSEPNSEIQIEIAKKLAPKFGLEIVSMGISNINEIPQTMDSMVKKVDAIYTITDNMVASAINIISEKAIANNMITVGAEDSHVGGGILITDGLSYYELGKQTASMAKSILIDGDKPSDIAVEKAQNTSKVFNEETMKKLNLDQGNTAFKDATKFEK
ncbi:ABC transporter substrate-binding protein [Tissierella creatinophila]|uniref:ABC transporter substrate binding protein n=1 Tax=Tissierella creatinophila DSM 6911 TaxID=1123403 RepID=A0A1U7M711_TISCR|nr:ABC transporter substrate-binding protein [Tissierella creatinophila]OLS03087.1 ABC transporter substrate binding protein [Tissierella creatinophila DSM 6911]